MAFVRYDFRHNFAIRFAEVTGGDVVALAAILGHQNLRTVMRYVHISQQHQDSAMDKYSAYIEEKTSNSGESRGAYSDPVRIQSEGEIHVRSLLANFPQRAISLFSVKYRR